MNKLSTGKKVAVITGLIEGCSVRSVGRMTGVAKGTILRLLAEVGKACKAYQDAAIRNVSAQRVQVDEIWVIIYLTDRTDSGIISSWTESKPFAKR